jgi:outer membrane lipoprotein SlyB
MSRELKVLGIADSHTHAESMITSLHTAGFALNDISALLKDRQATVDFAHDHSISYPEGPVEGAASGSVVGGALGILAGIGLSAIPGLGPFIGAGPLVAALSGVAFGGLAGALIGFGVPEVHAGKYEQELDAGRILLVVHAADVREANRAAQILVSGTARQVQTLEAGASSGVAKPVPRDS